MAIQKAYESPSRTSRRAALGDEDDTMSVGNGEKDWFNAEECQNVIEAIRSSLSTATEVVDTSSSKLSPETGIRQSRIRAKCGYCVYSGEECEWQVWFQPFGDLTGSNVGGVLVSSTNCIQVHDPMMVAKLRWKGEVDTGEGEQLPPDHLVQFILRCAELTNMFKQAAVNVINSGLGNEDLLSSHIYCCSRRDRRGIDVASILRMFWKSHMACLEVLQKAAICASPANVVSRSVLQNCGSWTVDVSSRNRVQSSGKENDSCDRSIQSLVDACLDSDILRTVRPPSLLTKGLGFGSRNIESVVESRNHRRNEDLNRQPFDTMEDEEITTSEATFASMDDQSVSDVADKNNHTRSTRLGRKVSDNAIRETQPRHRDKYRVDTKCGTESTADAELSSCASDDNLESEAHVTDPHSVAVDSIPIEIGNVDCLEPMNDIEWESQMLGDFKIVSDRGDDMKESDAREISPEASVSQIVGDDDALLMPMLDGGNEEPIEGEGDESENMDISVTDENTKDQETLESKKEVVPETAQESVKTCDISNEPASPSVRVDDSCSERLKETTEVSVDNGDKELNKEVLVVDSIVSGLESCKRGETGFSQDTKVCTKRNTNGEEKIPANQPVLLNTDVKVISGSTALRSPQRTKNEKWQANVYYIEQDRFIGTFDSKETAARAQEVATCWLFANASLDRQDSRRQIQAAIRSAREAACEAVDKLVGLRKLQEAESERATEDPDTRSSELDRAASDAAGGKEESQPNELTPELVSQSSESEDLREDAPSKSEQPERPASTETSKEPKPCSTSDKSKDIIKSREADPPAAVVQELKDEPRAASIPRTRIETNEKGKQSSRNRPKRTSRSQSRRGKSELAALKGSNTRTSNKRIVQLFASDFDTTYDPNEYGRSKRKIKSVVRFGATQDHRAEKILLDAASGSTGVGFHCPGCSVLCLYNEKKCPSCHLPCRYVPGTGVVVCRDRNQLTEQRLNQGAAAGEERVREMVLHARQHAKRRGIILKESSDNVRSTPASLPLHNMVARVEDKATAVPQRTDAEEERASDTPPAPGIDGTSKRVRKTAAKQTRQSETKQMDTPIAGEKQESGSVSEDEDSIKKLDTNWTQLDYSRFLSDYNACGLLPLDFGDSATSALAAVEAQLSELAKTVDGVSSDDEQHSLEMKIYNRGVRERQQKSDAERIEKLHHKEESETQSLELEYLNRRRKRSREEMEYEDLLSRPVCFEVRKLRRARPSEECFLGEACQLCLRNPEPREQSVADNVLLPCFRRVTDGVSCTQTVNNPLQRHIRNCNIVKRTVEKLTTLRHTLRFISAYNSGYLESESKRGKRTV